MYKRQLPKSSNYYLAINSAETGPEWAKNVDVRRALALAIDKESLVDVLGGDSFYPVLNGFVPDGVAGDTDTFRAAVSYTHLDVYKRQG